MASIVTNWIGLEEVEKAISYIKTDPELLRWKDAGRFNWTLFHYSAVGVGSDFITSVFQVNSPFPVIK